MTAHATALTPASVEITPRRMDFEFPATTPRYWLDRDPWRSHLMNALSLTFPAGEKMFVEAVRAFRDRITDPKLSADIRGFIGQEAMHSQEHSAFNEWLRAIGVDVDTIYAQVDARIALAEGRAPKEVMLAITCALEHFTAIMADMMMQSPEMYERMDPAVRDLWLWHAIEETEHKGVAFDVYRAIGGGYRMRVTTMALATVHFMSHIAKFQWQLLRDDGEQFKLRAWARGLRDYWGPRGYFTRLIPAYLDYYRPDFHPWQHDNSALANRWKAKILAGRDTRPNRRKSAATA